MANKLPRSSGLSKLNGVYSCNLSTKVDRILENKLISSSVVHSTLADKLCLIWVAHVELHIICVIHFGLLRIVDDHVADVIN